MTTSPAVLRPVGLPAMPLSVLLPGGPDQAVTGVSLDSRTVLPGDLYVALPGRAAHGASFASQAVAAGAVAVLTDPAGAAMLAGSAVPVIVVADPRRQMAELAAAVYGHPGERMALYAVTGTTGKTSTTFLIAAALAAAGQRVATIGTLGFALDGQPIGTTRTTVTTPESPDLQALLAHFAQAGADAIAMEVSSHALALHRVAPLVFEVAAFTNLGRDHLDFHADQEDYFQAKASLFREGRCRAAVIGIDDEYGQRLAAELRSTATPMVTTGEHPQADYRVTGRIPLPDGRSQVQLATPAGDREFVLGLLGAFNARNAATAAAMLEVAGIDLDIALPGLADAVVPGRMQRVGLPGSAPGVVVDFAHTPEAVSAALTGLPDGRRIVVLGCGGDRDQAKRAPMGAAAAERADVVIVTDDNPRSEDPQVIRDAVLAGARAAAIGSGAEVIDGGERAAAIRLALTMAGPRDWIAILGKGHETGQQLADRTVPFDDAAMAAALWVEVSRSEHA